MIERNESILLGEMHRCRGRGTVNKQVKARKGERTRGETEKPKGAKEENDKSSLSNT